MSIVDQIEHGTLGALLSDTKGRSSAITRTSLLGIVANLVLVCVKLLIGTVTHSVAIVGDAINNLSDALSSMLVIGGQRLSRRKPNRAHPYGYGRIEYLVTVIIGALIIFSGANILNESARRIITPAETSYEVPMLAVLLIAVLVKVALGLHFRKRGAELGSGALTAAGTDALMDSIVTLTTVVSAAITMVAGVSTEAYLGIIISAIVLKAGVEVLMQAVSSILGRRVEAEVADKVRAAAEGVDGVLRSCELHIVDYGPENVRGSIYVEVDERMTAVEIDRIAQGVKVAVYLDCRVKLNAVGFHPVSCATEEARQLRAQVEERLAGYPDVLGVYGFRLNEESGLAIFDVVADFDCPDREALAERIADDLAGQLPGYRFLVVTESNTAD